MAIPTVPLSKSIAEPLLSGAEFWLVIFALIIVVGLIGEYLIDRRKSSFIPESIEYPKSRGRRGKPTRKWNWLRFWMWVVIAGIVGELFCDAAIWDSSESLQVISDRDLKAALALAGPRNIHPEDDRAALTAALEPFRGTPYDLSIPPINNRSPLQQELLEPGSFLVGDLILVLSVLSGWKLQSVEGDILKAPLP